MKTTKRLLAVLLCAILLAATTMMPVHAGGDCFDVLNGTMEVDLVEMHDPDGVFDTAELHLRVRNTSQKTVTNFNLNAVSDDVTFLYITGAGSGTMYPTQEMEAVFRMQASFAAENLSLLERVVLFIRALLTDSRYAPVANEENTVFTCYYTFGDAPAAVQFQVSGTVI